MSVFLLIILPLLMVVVGVRLLRDYDNGYVFTMIALGGIFFVISALTLPVNRMSNCANIVQYGVIKESIKEARSCGDEFCALERAAVLSKIISTNEYLAGAKFWNQYFDLWWKDELVELEPLK